MPNFKNESTFLYDFLITPRFRIWRHTLLIIAIFIIAVDQGAYLYNGYFELKEYPAYLFYLYVFISYLAVGYFNIYVLIPKYLLTKRYVLYVIAILLLIFLRELLQNGFEYLVNSVFNLSCGDFSIFNPGNSVIIDLISTFFTEAISIIGVSTTVLLKYWIINNQHISRLENDHIQLEVEQLKEQVNPIFLFNILNKTGNLAKVDTAKASQMLMELSSILQYQLYDCSRNKVILSSEIDFVRNYLVLSKLNNDNFEFKISIIGNPNRILISPLLFIPFVQSAINETPEDGYTSCLCLVFEICRNVLKFSCTCYGGYSLNSPALLDIKRRLDVLYLDNYLLAIEEEKMENKIVKLQLNLV